MKCLVYSYITLPPVSAAWSHGRGWWISHRLTEAADVSTCCSDRTWSAAVQTASTAYKHSPPPSTLSQLKQTALDRAQTNRVSPTWHWPSIPRELSSRSTHMQKFKVNSHTGHTIQKTEWKQIDGQMNYITFLAYAVGNNSDLRLVLSTLIIHRLLVIQWLGSRRFLSTYSLHKSLQMN